MSLERREALMNWGAHAPPIVRNFVHDLQPDMREGSWDFAALSFERGFETMWDAARVDPGAVLVMPLLMLWRQSIELAIKSALYAITGNLVEGLGHNIQKLFQRLLEIRERAGCDDDNDYVQSAKAMIAEVQRYDGYADRFRYPSDKGDNAYAASAVDLDALFVAHSIIVFWCDASIEDFRRYY